MMPLDPLAAAMMTAEVVSNPMHEGVVLILAPPAEAGPGYVDGLYREALAGNGSLDPRLRRYPHRGVDTGGLWVWRADDAVDISRHMVRRTVSGGRDELWRLIGELDGERLDRSGPMWMFAAAAGARVAASGDRTDTVAGRHGGVGSRADRRRGRR
jgi:hypothetical protein